MNESTTTQVSFSTIKNALVSRFRLHEDQSGFDEIDQNIRNGIELKGTALWVLMLAIFIASIGLDVNSTAVIIGAMLISPLMGPIMGVGYGAGINDFALIKKAFGNLLISIAIALLTSTLYFLLSPLSTVQSELLARTTPSIWDVLIALFGGLAGIIALTRKEKSNILPGVAIATALMPPLCTAGYGIANGSMSMFMGAFYLFFINSVFIALGTILLVSYIDPPHKRSVSLEVERRVKRYIYIVVLGTSIPSIWLAYGMVTQELFNSRANAFIKHELVFDNAFIAKQQLSADKNEIVITLAGQKISEDTVSAIAKKMVNYKLLNTKLIVHQSTMLEADQTSITKSLLSGLFATSQETLDAKNLQIQELQNKILNLQSQHFIQAEYLKDQKRIFDELVAQYPQIIKLALAKADEHQITNTNTPPILLVNVVSKSPLSREDQHRVSAWLKIRSDVEQVKLTNEILRNMP